MKRLGVIAALALTAALAAVPALAAQFVQDGASMFSADTVSALDQKIGAFNAQTGKEIVVVTVPSLNGETIAQAAQTVFSEQKINGILIFISKGDRRDIIVPGTATAQFFPQATNVSIRQTMESQFKSGDYDGGITSAVNSILDIFRAHLNSAPGATRPNYNYPATTNGNVAVRQSSGVHISMFLWIVFIVVGFLVIRSILRAAAGPRYYGPGAGMPGGGPGYGPGPGYGGYYGGGGGGFWSGLLGGLGGAWLGNELFNRGGGSMVDPGTAAMQGGDTAGGGWGGNAPDAGGWGNDAGQADMGASSSGDFSGGGFGDGGGFGGGGFDGGGGGGDSGGGW